MYIYGIDLSMSCSGVSIYCPETRQFAYVGSIETDSSKSHGQRLKQQREYFYKLSIEYPPKEIAIERGFSRFNKSTQVIFMVHGVINELFHMFDIKYYSPGTVKKFVTGNGRAKKTELAKELKKSYPDIRFKNDDETDSFGVLITHLDKIGCY